MSLEKRYYHVQLKYSEPQKTSVGTTFDSIRTEQECDLSEEDATELGKQYSEGLVFFNGKWIDTSAIKEIEIRETQAKSRTFWGSVFQASTAEVVTRRFIKSQPRKEVEFPREKTRRPFDKTEQPTKNVFIVHGKDNVSKLELARILEKLGFKPMILSEQPDKGRTLIEKLENETIDIGFVFVILTPDDVGMERELYEKKTDGLCYRARQNVILELGYFVGMIGRGRVCCLYKGDLELPSDIHGVVYKKFEKSVEDCYKGIIDELKAAGYEIKI
jgi:predicted nucleotide-binding protein